MLWDCIYIVGVLLLQLTTVTKSRSATIFMKMLIFFLFEKKKTTKFREAIGNEMGSGWLSFVFQIISIPSDFCMAAPLCCLHGVEGDLNYHYI